MNKHTVKLPDGTTATRNSKTRLYSHVSLFTPNYSNEMGWARKCGHAAAQDFDYYVKADLFGRMQGCTDRVEYAAKVVSDAVARVETLKSEGHYEKRFLNAWHSREDLAQKAAINGAGYLAVTVL